MHKIKFADILETNSEFKDLFKFAKSMVHKKVVLGSQRALQFGGEPILRKNEKLYNCSATYIDRPRAFQEIMYLLLCGCGVGFSVQNLHINQLPNIQPLINGEKTYVVEDSIEGWANAAGVLVNSYFETPHEEWVEYKGCKINFDTSLIRPQGAPISGGFKAPGPVGLSNALEKIRNLIEKQLEKGNTKLRPIDAYDIIMHCSDAVLSGGVRRCLPGYYSVLMKNGIWKPIKNIEIGDEILYQNKTYPVTNVFVNGVQELLKINTKDGYHVSTPNHRWLVYNIQTKKIYWEEAQYINPKIHKFVKEKDK